MSEQCKRRGDFMRFMVPVKKNVCVNPYCGMARAEERAEKAEAEVERLTEALEQISIQSTHVQAAKIALKALQEEKDA